MSVRTTVARPAARSVGAAAVGLLVTLATFAVVILAFVVAPLILLVAALAAYAVLRPQAGRATSTGDRGGRAPRTPSGVAGHRFGAGTA